jgi:hypothetical protein
MPDKGGMTGIFCRVCIGQARRFQDGPESFRKIKLKQVFLQVLNELQQLRVATV